MSCEIAKIVAREAGRLVVVKSPSTRGCVRKRADARGLQSLGVRDVIVLIHATANKPRVVTHCPMSVKCRTESTCLNCAKFVLWDRKLPISNRGQFRPHGDISLKIRFSSYGLVVPRVKWPGLICTNMAIATAQCGAQAPTPTRRIGDTL